MKKIANKIISFIVMISMLIGTFSQLTVIPAADEFKMWIDANPQDGAACEANSVSALNWWKNEVSYYIVLPSHLSKEDVNLYFSGAVNVTVNDQPVSSGDSCSLTAINKVIADGNEYTLKIRESEIIASMCITTESGSLDAVHADKEHKEKGSAAVIRADGTVDYNGELKQIKGRGNATWEFDKKPYNIKLEESADLLGMGESKNWCLIANYTDKSQLKNKIMYDLANQISSEKFNMQSRHVNLYINGDYLGLYQLTEKVEIDENRVDITDLEKATEKANMDENGEEVDLDSFERCGNFGDAFEDSAPGAKKWYNIPNDPDDITGGYLLEIDLYNRYRKEASGFVTKEGIPVVTKSPEYASKAQIDYISRFFGEMTEAVYSDDGYNSLGKHYSEYIDTESFADAYLLQEICMNLDAAITSCFIYKDSDITGDGKFHAEPIWDCDNAMGGSTGRPEFGLDLTNLYDTCVDKGKILDSDDYFGDYQPHLFAALYKHSDFSELLKSKYGEYYDALSLMLSGVIEDDSYYSDFSTVESYKRDISAAAANDAIKWERIDYSNSFQTNLDLVLYYLENHGEYLNDLYRVTGYFNVIADASIVYKDGNCVPNIKVYSTDGDLLTVNRDYTVACYDNEYAGKNALAVITGIGDYSYYQPYYHYYSITAADINEIETEIIPDYEYTGSEIIPKVNFINADLKEMVDYRIHFYDNINPGTATVRIVGINNYKGVKTLYFNIIGKTVKPPVGDDSDKNPQTNNDNVSVKQVISKKNVLPIKTKVYTGKALKPAIRIKISGRSLKPNTDYTVEYVNNRKCGRATAIVIGKGSYSGVVKVTFKIKPQKTQKLKVSVKGRTAKITFKKAKGASKTAVYYSTNKKMKKASVKKVSKSRLTVRRLKKGKTYYFKAIGFSGSLYGAATKIIKVKVK